MARRNSGLTWESARKVANRFDRPLPRPVFAGDEIELLLGLLTVPGIPVALGLDHEALDRELLGYMREKSLDPSKGAPVHLHRGGERRLHRAEGRDLLGIEGEARPGDEVHRLVRDPVDRGLLGIPPDHVPVSQVIRDLRVEALHQLLDPGIGGEPRELVQDTGIPRDAVVAGPAASVDQQRSGVDPQVREHVERRLLRQAEKLLEEPGDPQRQFAKPRADFGLAHGIDQVLVRQAPGDELVDGGCPALDRAFREIFPDVPLEEPGRIPEARGILLEGHQVELAHQLLDVRDRRALVLGEAALLGIVGSELPGQRGMQHLVEQRLRGGIADVDVPAREIDLAVLDRTGPRIDGIVLVPVGGQILGRAEEIGEVGEHPSERPEHQFLVLGDAFRIHQLPGITRGEPPDRLVPHLVTKLLELLREFLRRLLDRRPGILLALLLSQPVEHPLGIPST